ncbi:MAG: shikimate dehydrogenase [bacterium]|nr:shikimate dehydrogenase [bacterium]
MPDLSRTFCVIGDPIAHSLSPLIHAAVFSRLGVPMAYEAVRVAPDRLAAFVAESRSARRPGFNVTIPHKQAVIPFLDGTHGDASLIGAVNTVAAAGGKLTGYNTDVDGCRAALSRGGWSPAAEGVLLLGAGGAGRAAVRALSLEGVKKLSVFETDRGRAESMKTGLAAPLGLEMEILSSPAALEAAVRGAGLLINATPVGLWPAVGGSPLPDHGWLSPSCLVFDMVPNPVETRLLREARLRGCRTVAGVVMLVSQALAADTLWLGRPMPDGLFEVCLSLCIQHLEAHGHAPDSHRG